MQQSLIQFLTKDSIKFLKENNAIGNQLIVVQVVKFLKDDNNEQQKDQDENTLITISDGFSKINVFAVQEAEKLVKEFKEDTFPVIKIVDKFLFKIDKNSQIFITKMDIIYNDIKELIGEPMEYSLFCENSFINQQGSSTIPEKYIIQSNKQQPQQQQQKSNYQQQYYPQLHPALQHQKKQQFGNQQNQQQDCQQNVQMEDEKSEFQTISQLTPLLSNWKLKARVLHKSQIRCFQRQQQQLQQQSEGKVFSIEITDISQKEIQCSFFDDVASKFYDYLIVGQVYTFTKGKLNQSNQNSYNNNNNNNNNGNNGNFIRKVNQLNIVFDANSIIEQVEDDNTIGGFDMKLFTPISKINQMQQGSLVDVIGVVSEVQQVQEIVARKSGKNMKKKSFFLCDQSYHQGIEVTLWNSEIDQFECNKGNVLIIKQAKVGEFYQQKNLSVNFNSTILENQFQIQEVQALKDWYEQNYEEINQSLLQKKQNPQPKNQLVNIKHIEEVCKDKQDINFKNYSEIIGQISNIKTENLYYLSCINDKCGKKAIQDQETKKYRCDSCKIEFEQPKAKYISTMKLEDETGNLWCNAFDNIAQQLFGKSADELRILKDQGDDTQLKDILNKIINNKKFKFTIFSKVENFNEINRIKHQIFKLNDIEIIE